MITATWASLWLPRPDVVIATSPQFFCGWAGVFVSRLRRAPLLLEIRDIWPESIAAVGAMRNRLLLRILETLERWLYRAARHIVAVGDGYRNKVLEKLGYADRVSVITNGADLDQFVPQEPDPRLLHMWDIEDRFVCAYVGTVGMAHGLEVILAAAEKLAAKSRRDIVFWIVGDGAQREQLERKAAESGLEDLVVFAGRQPKEDIPRILASSDACLIHLKRRTLFETVIPSKMFETMAMQRPLIIGVRGEAADIVARAGAGIEIQPECADALVSAVEQLADSPSLANELSMQGREFVAQHYSRDVLADRFLRLLECVAEGSSPVSELPLPEETTTEVATFSR